MSSLAFRMSLELYCGKCNWNCVCIQTHQHTASAQGQAGKKTSTFLRTMHVCDIGSVESVRPPPESMVKGCDGCAGRRDRPHTNPRNCFRSSGENSSKTFQNCWIYSSSSPCSRDDQVSWHGIIMLSLAAKLLRAKIYDTPCDRTLRIARCAAAARRRHRADRTRVVQAHARSVVLLQSAERHCKTLLPWR